jgi:hypothetical protein
VDAPPLRVDSVPAVAAVDAEDARSCRRRPEPRSRGGPRRAPPWRSRNGLARRTPRRARAGDAACTSPLDPAKLVTSSPSRHSSWRDRSDTDREPFGVRLHRAVESCTFRRAARERRPRNEARGSSRCRPERSWSGSQSCSRALGAASFLRGRSATAPWGDSMYVEQSASRQARSPDL